MRIDLIYLDNQNSATTNDWKYYRVTAIYQMHIEVCEVEFPTLKDKGVPTQHPFIVGLNAAQAIKREYLESLGINQDRAVMIGLVVRNEKGAITSASGQPA